MNINLRLLFLVASLLSVGFLCGMPASKGVQELCQAIDKHKYETACSSAVELIEQGEDLNNSLPQGSNGSGETLLHKASQQAMPRLVSLLLQNGAQVDAEMVMDDDPVLYGKDVKEVRPRDLPIHRSLAYRHNTSGKKTGEELYKRGAYPASRILEKVSSNGERRPVRECSTDMLHGLEHAFARIRVVHGWLDTELSGLDLDKRRGVEELIRSLEISSKQEGKEFYWSTVMDSDHIKAVHACLNDELQGVYCLEELIRSLAYGEDNATKQFYWDVVAEHEQDENMRLSQS